MFFGRLVCTVCEALSLYHIFTFEFMRASEIQAIRYRSFRASCCPCKRGHRVGSCRSQTTLGNVTPIHIIGFLLLEGRISKSFLVQSHVLVFLQYPLVRGPVFCFENRRLCTQSEIRAAGRYIREISLVCLEGLLNRVLHYCACLCVWLSGREAVSHRRWCML